MNLPPATFSRDRRTTPTRIESSLAPTLRELGSSTKTNPVSARLRLCPPAGVKALKTHNFSCGSFNFDLRATRHSPDSCHIPTTEVVGIKSFHTEQGRMCRSDDSVAKSLCDCFGFGVDLK